LAAASRRRGGLPTTGRWRLFEEPTMAREYVWLECTECNSRNYRTPKETRGTDRLELKKFCNRDRRHTVHKESRKK
jgi:large subunit ribosomal protein L33